MAENLKAPTDFEVWDHIRTHSRWRSEASDQLRDLAKAVDLLPEIKREQDRQSVALFSTNSDNEITNMKGIVPMVREVVIGYRVTKWIAYMMAIALFGLFGLLIGMLKKLASLGVLDALMK
jgi:hypothetical protein